MSENIITMLDQIGGNAFLTMTGCHHIVFSNKENSVRMQIPKNAGKVNRMEITYVPSLDLYSMKFYKYTAGRYNPRTGVFTDDKVTNEKIFEGVFADQLANVFEAVTGMYTMI